MTEHALENVVRTAALRTVIVRLGQVAGDKHGYWNEREWFPALVKTAIYQRCLPDLEGVCVLSSPLLQDSINGMSRKCRGYPHTRPLRF